MARPKDKEDVILAAAVQVFMERGFASTSIQDIASLAGLAKGTIYEYFKSKDELFIESVKYQKCLVDKMLNENLTRYNVFLDKINAMLDLIMRSETNQHIKWMDTVINAFPALKAESKAEFQNVMAGMQKGGIDIWADILRCGVQEGIIADIDIEFKAACVFCLTTAYNHHIHEQRAPQYHEEKNRLLKFIFQGIGF